MALFIGCDGYADRGTNRTTGDGAITPANFRAHSGSESATDSATQHSITVHGQCGCRR
jgi:hypothetical protein